MKGSEECFMKNMIIGIAGAIAVAALGGTGAFASGQMSGSSPAAVVQETVWESDAEGCTYGHHVDGCNGDCQNSTSATGCHNSGSCYSSSCYNSSCAGGYGSDHHSSHHGGWHE